MADVLGETLILDPLAFGGLEAVELVADWKAGEQIDITLLLDQFADGQPQAGAVAAPFPEAVIEAPADAGDVILLDFGISTGVAALYDGQPAPLADG